MRSVDETRRARAMAAAVNSRWGRGKQERPFFRKKKHDLTWVFGFP